MLQQQGPSKVVEILSEIERKPLLRFSTAGSVDDGKSTLIGRLLHDSKSIFEDTLSSVKKATKAGGTDLEVDLSLVTDGLKAEREQKITIDVAYRYFSTPKRSFILADTPGHEQYTRNMATGASTSDAAIVLVDALKGVQTQTRRHSFILSLLGVKHILVAINKMDAVGYSQEVFEKIRREYSAFAAKLEVPDIQFVPISALKGDNVVNRTDAMPWHTGTTVLSYLEDLYTDADRNLIDFRFPVQLVIRPNQNFRGYAGTLASGVVRVGDEVLVLPSRAKTKVKAIYNGEQKLDVAYAPMSVVITTETEVDISRGDLLVSPNNITRSSTQPEAMLVWMDREGLDPAKKYWVKHGTRWVKGTVDRIHYRVDVNTLSRNDATTLAANEIGRVKLDLVQPLFHDSYERNRGMGSFILVDPITNQTAGAGLLLDRITEQDISPESAQNAATRNIFADPSAITPEQREAKTGQKAVTIWMTGLSGAGKSALSKRLERLLFNSGRMVYRLDGDNLRTGLNKDLGFSQKDRSENVRRVAEAAKLLNEAGVIVISSLISPLEADRRLAESIIGKDRFFEVHVDASIEACEKRDVKGLYKKARAGEIPEFTGISSPYEAPRSPKVRVRTDVKGPDECVAEILSVLEKAIQRK